MAGDEEEDSDAPSEDRIIDSRAFQMGGGIDLNAFMPTDDLASAKRPALLGGSPTDATAGVEVKGVSESDHQSYDAIG